MPFDPDQLIQDICNDYELRFREEDVADDDIEVMINFLARMAGVAIQLASQEQDLKLPGSDNVIPFDEGTQQKTVRMFCEGLAFALLQTAQMNIPDEARGEILQNVAQHVYETAKQVVLSTFGQEHTPEFQIPEEQQLSMVSQTAESALHFFVGEYEKVHGSFQQVDMGPADPMMSADIDAMTAAPPEFDLADDDIPPPLAAPEVASEPVAPPPPRQPQPIAPPPLPHPLEKYAALAMLLNVLPSQRAHKLYTHFSPPEQQAIAQFQHPIAMMEAGLNLVEVQSQLAALKKRFHPQPVATQEPMALHPREPVGPAQPIAAIDTPSVPSPLQQFAQVPNPALLKQVVAQERPNIREAIDALFDEDNGQHLLAPLETPRRLLPKAIERVLAEHLEKLVG